MVVWTIWDNYASLSIITNKEFSQTLSVQMYVTQKSTPTLLLLSHLNTPIT